MTSPVKIELDSSIGSPDSEQQKFYKPAHNVWEKKYDRVNVRMLYIVNYFGSNFMTSFMHFGNPFFHLDLNLNANPKVAI